MKITHEEMKSSLMKMVAAIDAVDRFVDAMQRVYIPARTWDIIGGPLDRFSNVHTASSIECACRSGQLSIIEVPDGIGVYVSVSKIEYIIADFKKLLSVPYNEIKELMDDDEYAKLASLMEKSKDPVEKAISVSSKTAKLLEAYIEQAKEQPFKDNWEKYAQQSLGLSESLTERAVETLSGYNNSGNRSQAKEISSKFQAFSEELLELGKSYTRNDFDKVKIFEDKAKITFADLVSSVNSFSMKMYDPSYSVFSSNVYSILRSMSDKLQEMSLFVNVDTVNQ